MPRISEASRLYIGVQAASKAYLGDEQVWSAGIIDQENIVDQWLAIDSQTTSGGRVPTWTGRINRVVASQETESKQPRYYVTSGEPSFLMAGSLMNTTAFVPPGKMTVYAKVLFSTAPGSSANSTVFCQDTGGNKRSWHCGVSSTKRARFVNFDGAGLTGQAVELDGTVTLGQWQILEGVRDAYIDIGGTILSGMDNVFTSPLTITNTTYQVSPLAMTIGGRGAGNELMNGYISELRIYRAVHSLETRRLVRAEMGVSI